MKILITGGSGFIGSNFILNYIEKHQILNYDKLTYAGNLDNLQSIENHSNYSFFKGDINDKNKISDILNSFNPECIINFAAESHVDRSIDSPRSFIETNILGTFELLNSSYKYFKTLSIKQKKDFRFLHISTDEVYGSLGIEGKFTELTPYSPSSPYSASKASSDHLVKSWYHTYDFPILITNCSNNYGPYQFPEKLIPLMITKCLQHEKLPIYGNGTNIRDWIYVKDHCNGIYKALKHGTVGETYNIGGDQEVDNLKIVKLICSILDRVKPSNSLDSYSSLISFVEDRPGHDFRYAVDSTKIKDELNFKINQSIESGLEKTINWYLDNLEWINNIRVNKYNQERLGVI